MQPPFRLDGAVHSRPEDYARLLAPLGYVVFVVEYRLAPENPEPDLSPGESYLVEDLKAYITPTVFAATARARVAAGQAPLTSDKDRLWLWKAGIAAAEVAITHAKTAITKDPEFAMGHATLGFGLALSGEADKGRESAELAVALQPSDAFSRWLLAMSYLMIKDPVKAIIQAKEASRLDPLEHRMP